MGALVPEPPRHVFEAIPVLELALDLCEDGPHVCNVGAVHGIEL